MRLIMTIIWSILISGAISYVLTSMAGEPFNITFTLIVASFFVVAIFVLGEGALKETER